MKANVSIIKKVLGILVAPIAVIPPIIKDVALLTKAKVKSTQTFNWAFWKEGTQNRVAEFKHLRIKQFKIYNPFTQKKEYYLDEYGRKYLIKRFRETGLIGPEISTLKWILIGGQDKLIGSATGIYYPAFGLVGLNANSFLSSTKNLQNDKDKKLLAERRVEVLLPTLIHEYAHHFFNAYAESPIGYHPNNQNKQQNIQQVYAYGTSEPWNKEFYKNFKKLFFENGVVKTTAHKNSKFRLREIFETEISNLARNERINAQSVLRSYTSQSTKLLYDKSRIPDIRTIFETANENRSVPQVLMKRTRYSLGVDFRAMAPGMPKGPYLWSVSTSSLPYHYWMPEQVVKKLVLAIFKPSGKFAEIDKSVRFEHLFSNDYIPSKYIDGKEDEENNYYRFYSDNVFPAANSSLEPAGTSELEAKDENRSKAYVEILDELMGHKNHAHLSFVATKALEPNGKAYLPLQSGPGKDYLYIKIGGFIDSDEYNYVGYKNAGATKFQKIPIQVNKFNIYYKKQAESRDGFNLKSYRGINQEYYWYSNAFTNKANIANKNLYFLTVKNGVVTKSKKFTSVRKNRYGIANNFNLWKAKDKFFKQRIMQDVNSGPKWLVVGRKDSSGVKIVSYDKQEEVEQIWRKEPAPAN